MYTVTVTEYVGAATPPNEPECEVAVERYRQSVDILDLQKLIAAVNIKPRNPRKDLRHNL